MRILSNGHKQALKASQIHPIKTLRNGFYSTKRISPKLIDEIGSALKSVDAYGSVEIYIQNSEVTQITTRSIRKTRGAA